MIVKYICLIFCFSASFVSFSQAINVTNTGGGFNQTTTWSSGARPSSSNAGTWNNGGTVNTISLNGTSTTGSPCTDGTRTTHNAVGFNCGEIGSLTGSKNGGTINVSFARIKIFGDFGFNNTVTINISNGGILEITGNINVNNNLDVNFGANCDNCKFLVNSFTAGQNAAITVSGGGEFNVSGDFATGTGANIDIDSESTVIIGGDFNVGGGTVTVNGCNSPCEDGQLIIGGTVTVPGGIDGTGTVVVESDPNYLCTDPLLNCVDGQGDPLPVVLGSFTVIQSNNQVKLNWKTLSEVNFNYFEIDKYNGIDFQSIGTVKSTGKENGDNYTFEDRNPKIGLNIYRLKSIDFDGYTEEFEAKSTIFEPKNLNLQFYPNPAQAGQVTSDIFTDFTLEVYGLNGKLIKRESIQQNNVDLVNCLPAGIYILKYDINGLQKSQRMIIR